MYICICMYFNVADVERYREDGIVRIRRTVCVVKGEGVVSRGVCAAANTAQSMTTTEDGRERERRAVCNGCTHRTGQDRKHHHAFARFDIG